MARGVSRPFFLAFVKLHILYHAGQGPVFGLELLRQLARHGYGLSPGTLYPALHALEAEGYLRRQARVEGGRRRVYYTATRAGRRLLAEGRRRAGELMDELIEVPAGGRRRPKEDDPR